ncbi:DUF2254 domain-containing protein [Ornithinimicrobium pekingense]|uniref:DUF2254 domain-containing protein n=1 Tax=Ornithinimicrobium pekingense TaxID=384677 RepID=A0ABQ2F829_9MICO|nr:DUF2254 domain-containing protein [Ornithinimicrobium pekingense]GGK71191.1 hypothetical protein GCM10011509_19560 [Ornithinimicrobium pekingense]
MPLLRQLGERFWFVPALLCLVAVVLSQLLVWVDRVWEMSLPGWADTLLYRVGESGSRDILGAIAGSSLAVAGTTFSITMAVLALTSSSYGPRLIRNFMTDRGNQVVLGVYVATFLYSLLVLRSVRAIGDPGDPEAEVFVPHLAVNFAVVLAVLNVAVLIYFIHHISDSIQISTISRRVRTDLRRTVERLYPEQVGHGPEELDGPEPHTEEACDHAEEHGEPVRAGRQGYVTAVHGDDLVRTAQEAGGVVHLRVRPGQYVLQDSVVAHLHADAVGEDALDAVRDAVQVDDARSPYQDVSFAVQQLTELAVRALSPGTNDPFTAVNALDDLSSGLSLLAQREMPSTRRYDDAGALRVCAPQVGAVELTSTVLDNVRWYAVTSPSVMHAALDLVRRVGRHARHRDLRARLLTQVRLLEEAFERADHQQHDVEEYAERVRETERVLAQV